MGAESSLVPAMEGSVADGPTVVKSPGNADAPVVPNTSELTRMPFDPTSAMACCWLENRVALS